MNEELECRPTFEQLGMDRIIDEAHKNVNALKAIETLVSERLSAHAAMQQSAHKIKTAFEAFETVDGSLKLALDSFYLYTEQVGLLFQLCKFLTIFCYYFPLLCCLF